MALTIQSVAEHTFRLSNSRVYSKWECLCHAGKGAAANAARCKLTLSWLNVLPSGKLAVAWPVKISDRSQTYERNSPSWTQGPVLGNDNRVSVHYICGKFGKTHRRKRLLVACTQLRSGRVSIVKRLRRKRLAYTGRNLLALAGSTRLF